MLSATRQLFVSATLVLAASAASAQVTAPYAESFDAALPAGWTVTSTSAEVFWNADYDAACDPVGDGLGGSGPDGPRVGSSGGSLNYNDGTDFEDSAFATATGTATSPIIDVSPLAGSVLISWQNVYENEWYSFGSSFYDTMTVTILDSSDVAVPGLTFSVGDAAFFGPIFGLNSGPMGTRALLTIDASAALTAAGVTSIRIRFSFNSLDGGLNDYDGWFIDNLTVSCLDATPPGIPTPLLPADGTTVPSPPGVVLDWSNATDTASCGGGTVTNYIVEVDTTNPPVTPFTYSGTPAVSTATTGILGAGTYYWWVRAVDAAGNVGANSPVFSLTVEAPLAPLAADTLYVNASGQGAQSGRSGFVDPIVDEYPVMSALYRDANTVDFAVSLRYQISDDPTFAVLVFDSGTLAIAPPLAKDGRTEDLASGVRHSRDTVYYWRILFTDVGGLTGAFSPAQSYRIGDDFDFGVRRGSSNHSRRCWVSTASYGGIAPEVRSLMTWRAEVVEGSGAGRVFSRAYAACGSGAARQVGTTGSRRAAVRHALAPLVSCAERPATSGVLVCLLGLCLFALARRRM